MPIKDFDELEIFKKARKLTNMIYDISQTTPFNKDFALRDQIRRSSTSIMANIAEGFERNSNQEFIQFLHISKGSCAETRAQLMIAVDRAYITNKEYNELHNSCKEIGRMTNGLIRYLKNSEIKKRNK